MTDQDLVSKAVKLCGSQMELARRMKTSPSVISYWRRGVFKPDATSKAKLEAIINAKTADYHKDL
jgi:ribosome-binding protein aMBF1 (putative translation factor)